MERHRKLHGRRLDADERERKKEARSGEEGWNLEGWSVVTAAAAAAAAVAYRPPL